MAYEITYSNQDFDFCQIAAGLLSDTPGYTAVHFGVVEDVIKMGTGPMPSPKDLAALAKHEMAKTYECVVCKGKGELDIEFEYQTSFDMDHGPNCVDVKATIECEDCRGDGSADRWVHEEQHGGRIGTVEDWIDSMVDNYIENGLHDDQ